MKYINIGNVSNIGKIYGLDELRTDDNHSLNMEPCL